jgi:FkbM family methyltransferase
MINTLKEIRIFNERISFYDHKKSNSVYWIQDELNEEYNLNKLTINDNDVIIDIGAHVGVVSTYLAKANPNCKIYSFEPTSNTFHCLSKNIIKNEIKNVKIFNTAITSDGRDVIMNMPIGNTGGSSLLYEPSSGFYYKNSVKSLPINNVIEDILKTENTDKIKLLKIDCEGAEYDIIKNIKPELFSKIENIIGEFHTINGDEVNTPKNLLEYCEQYVNPDKIKVRFL